MNRFESIAERIPCIAVVDGFLSDGVVRASEVLISSVGDNEALSLMIPLYVSSDGTRHSSSAPLSVLVTAMNGGDSYSTVCNFIESCCSRMQLRFGDYCVEEHSHDLFELTLILDGEADICIEGVHHRYGAGDACLINSNVRHREDYSKRFTAAYVEISREYVQGYMQKHPLAARRSRIARFFADNLDEKRESVCDYIDFFKKGGGAGTASELLLDLLEELLESKPGAHYIAMGLLSRLMDSLQNSEEYNMEHISLDSAKEKKLVDAATRYIEKKKARVTRAELARALHYNGDYIDQVFRKHSAVSLHDFSVSVCLNEATRLLRGSDMSVSEIIKSLGYENRTSFYSIFRRNYGMTPIEYRQKLKTSEQNKGGHYQ